MTQERTGVTTFGGNPVTLLGTGLKVGDKAPNFEVTANNMSTVTLDDTNGKVRVISVVPSLDTGVCDAQTRRFNEEAAKLGEAVAILTISADLPFAQRRWCGAAGIDKVQTLSDYKTMSFGNAFGTHIKEFRLEARSVFVVDSSNTVVYVEYLENSTGPHPDYEAAIQAAKAAK